MPQPRFISVWTTDRPMLAPDGPGVALVGARGISLEPGQAVEPDAIGFSLTREIPDDVLDWTPVDVTFPTLLRLDEVSFPPGAVAYRHTHPGPGYRYLRRGQLTLEGYHTEIVEAGEWWFEAANSPVQATASEVPETRFVRAMVLRPEDLGRSTFTLCDPADAEKERLQTTHRHVDLILEA